MNVNPEYRKALGKWGHNGEGETVEFIIVPPMDTIDPPAEHIEFNIEFDVSSIEKLFVDYPELNKQKHDGP